MKKQVRLFIITLVAFLFSITANAEVAPGFNSWDDVVTAAKVYLENAAQYSNGNVLFAPKWHDNISSLIIYF